MSNLLDRLPIIPHSGLGPDCCGCLIVEEREQDVAIVCNECGVVVCTVLPEQVERTLAELGGTVCAARCIRCGARNTFQGFSSIEVFVCAECGESVTVATVAQ